ncbi:hypothetical protein GSI_10541 [Ganoderma sinense ZZ0214-1]|uniref:Uncharacterized protein n=1 Tax=Ganoderma sinense ZZ0214-1 TaxID=1077348 RepID=A0A2G8S0U5_9APHY|nr:hypothetical protein GSI_10541 [Ganoderma sinense ZZ0214-1]
MLKRQDSKDSGSPTFRRPSWTGALGARLGMRRESALDEQSIASEETYGTMVDGASLESLKQAFGVMVGGRKRDDPDSPSSFDRRSVSRGREAFSSGRGGIGNIRRPSVEAASPPRGSGGEPLSPVRGREARVDPERAQSTGRGGMGNIRSGSRARNISLIPENHPQTASLVSDHAASVAEYERAVLERSEEAANARARSSGRGGIGNIKSGDNSHSRSRSRAPMTSIGRGGAGNIQTNINTDTELLVQLDDEERLKYAHDEGVHSTGRGGRANLTSKHTPPLESVSAHPYEFETTGRGGVGNMIRSRSSSREPDQSRSRSASRTPSKDRASSLARILNRVGLHSPREGEGSESPHGMSSVTELTEPSAAARASE